MVQFRAHYPSGCMLHNWAELLFTPLGSVPVPSLPYKLPKWSPDKEPVYAEALDRLIAELYRDDTQMERLEAYLPLFLDQSEQSKREATIDRVRWCISSTRWKRRIPNLVLIVFSYYSGYQVRQNGAGSGPPRMSPTDPRLGGRCVSDSMPDLMPAFLRPRRRARLRRACAVAAREQATRDAVRAQLAKWLLSASPAI